MTTTPPETLARRGMTCPDCGLDVQLRDIHDTDTPVTLDAYRRPVSGLAYIIRHDLTATPYHRAPDGYHDHRETCPSRIETGGAA